MEAPGGGVVKLFEQLFANRAAGDLDDSLAEVLISRPGVISFSGGLPDPAVFEMEKIQAVAAEISSDPLTWQYTPTEGWMPLRERMSQWMREAGVPTEPENILITHGSQSALDLVAKALLDPGDAVLVESPGYLGGLKAIQSFEGRLVPIPLDEEGLDPEAVEKAAMERRPKFLYTVSTFQNPTGATLSLERRRRLVELAEKHGFLIVEDGAYESLRYEGQPLPSLAQLDQAGRVIYLGSFSKSLIPGVRIGWIRAHRTLAARFALLKQAADLATNTFGQRFVHLWIERHGVKPPLERYRQKRDLCGQALNKRLQGAARWQTPQGGFFYWLALRDEIDAAELLVTAREEGVSFAPGFAFGGPGNTLRLSFSQCDPAEIEPGVERLARALEKAHAARRSG